MPAPRCMRVITLFLCETDGGSLVGYHVSQSSQSEMVFSAWTAVELIHSKAAKLYISGKWYENIGSSMLSMSIFHHVYLHSV